MHAHFLITRRTFYSLLASHKVAHILYNVTTLWKLSAVDTMLKSRPITDLHIMPSVVYHWLIRNGSNSNEVPTYVDVGKNCLTLRPLRIKVFLEPCKQLLNLHCFLCISVTQGVSIRLFITHFLNNRSNLRRANLKITRPVAIVPV